MTLSRINRVQNVSGHGHCEYCCGTGNQPDHVSRSPGGWVFVGYSGVGTDQLAPCPYCEAGWIVEFPEKGKGPWGFEGYWRGRETAGLEKTCRCSEKPLSPVENKARLAGLMRKLSAVGNTP